jgi:hypothetical protein
MLRCFFTAGDLLEEKEEIWINSELADFVCLPVSLAACSMIWGTDGMHFQGKPSLSTDHSTISRTIAEFVQEQ